MKRFTSSFHMFDALNIYRNITKEAATEILIIMLKANHFNLL